VNISTIIFAYAVASRLAYVLFVGIALRRQERDAIYTRRYGETEGFRRFRRVAAIIMNHDAVVFILLCVVTRNTLTLPVSRLAAIVVGAVFVIVGVGIKIWAARTLGSNAYYWHNFFAPNDAQGPVSTGPYRFASNPMYTIGYLHTYGLALILGSLPGLVVSAFAHAAILAMYFLVEKPHFERLHRPS
jgi:protein-S-isoprenylcysteine O-methyltransferase Ste14